jgi:hypothetical protein
MSPKLSCTSQDLVIIEGQTVRRTPIFVDENGDDYIYANERPVKVADYASAFTRIRRENNPARISVNKEKP